MKDMKVIRERLIKCPQCGDALVWTHVRDDLAEGGCSPVAEWRCTCGRHSFRVKERYEIMTQRMEMV